MRGFRCLPLASLHSVVLSGLTSFERDCYYSGVAAQDDRHCLPWQAAALRSSIFPNRPFVGLSQVAAARDKLVALGVWLHKTTPRKEWLEIHPDYRHSEGNSETSYGDEPEAPGQGELRFATVLAPPRAQKINGSRAESDSKQSKDPIPPAADTALARAFALEQWERKYGKMPGNREGEGRKEPGKQHSRTLAQLTAVPLGRRLFDFIGPAQMVTELQESGAEWMRILNDESGPLEELLEQGERTRAAMPSGRTRAMFLTKRLKERRAA